MNTTEHSPRTTEAETVARAQARGRMQRRWVEDMLDPDGCGDPVGKTYLAASQRKNGARVMSYLDSFRNLCDRLEAAGLEVARLPIGPANGMRYVIDNQHTFTP